MSAKMVSVILLSMTVLHGCSSGRSRGPAVGPQGVDREIVVENGTSVDIQVAAIVGSSTLSLGSVRANSSRTIRLPSTVRSTFRMMAEPRGNSSMAGRLYSEPISIDRVNEATWEIRSGIAIVVYRPRGAVRP